MKLRHYLSLYRGPGLVLRVGLILLVSASLFFTGSRVGDRPDAVDALVLLEFLVLPLFFGVMFAMPWKAPHHQPLTWMVPQFRTALLRWHVRALVAVAAWWTVFLRLAQPDFPSAAAFAITLGILTIPSAFEGFLISNRRLPFLGLLALSIAVATHPHQCREWLLAHWGMAGAVGLLTAAGSIGLARNRDMHRRRANFPMSFTAGDHLSWGETARLQRQTQGRPLRWKPGTWHYPPRGDSLVRWVRAKIETQPGNKFVALAFTLAGILIVPPLFVSLFRWSLVGWHDLIFQSPGGKFTDYGALFVTLLLLPSMTPPQAIPGAGIFYPLARGRRARLAFVSAILRTATLWVTLTGGALAAGFLAALWLGQPTPAHLALEFIVRTASILPFLPILQWLALRYPDPRREGESVVRYLLSVVAVLLAAILFALEGGLATWALICATGIVVSQIGFFFALRHLFAKRDLMYNTTPPRCMGLV